MDLIKVGKYIASKRKALGLTQAQLAEKLGMSSKSVSKWERGVCLPDVSVYLELCQILGITLNEFIAGEDLKQEEMVQKSEENLMQVAEEGNVGKKKLKRIIAVLLCASLLALGALSAVLLALRRVPVNYIEPLPKDSAEMNIAKVLSGVDGAYLYRYALDDTITELRIMLSVYKEGTLERTEEAASLKFELSEGQDRVREGIAAIVPDFENFKVRLILTDSSAKYSTDFNILEGVPDREYYGRSASEIQGRIKISPDTDMGILALIYAEGGLRVLPVEDIPESAGGAENDYVYYLSFRFVRDSGD